MENYQPLTTIEDDRRRYWRNKIDLPHCEKERMLVVETRPVSRDDPRALEPLPSWVAYPDATYGFGSSIYTILDRFEANLLLNKGSYTHVYGIISNDRKLGQMAYHWDDVFELVNEERALDGR